MVEWDFMGFSWDLPGLVNIQKAMEHGHRNSDIVDFFFK